MMSSIKEKDTALEDIKSYRCVILDNWLDLSGSRAIREIIND